MKNKPPTTHSSGNVLTSLKWILFFYLTLIVWGGLRLFTVFDTVLFEHMRGNKAWRGKVWEKLENRWRKYFPMWFSGKKILSSNQERYKKESLIIYHQIIIYSWIKVFLNRTNNAQWGRGFLLTESNFFTSSDEYAKIIDHFLSIYYGWGVCLFIALVDVFFG